MTHIEVPEVDGTILARLLQKLEMTVIDARLPLALGALLDVLVDSGCHVDRLDKSLFDFHIDALDRQVNEHLDAVLHSPQFQAVESAWRGLKYLVDGTDFRENVRIEVLDCSKETLQRDFDDTPELIESGLYHHAYIQEYDTPGGQPIGSIISDFEFVNSAKDTSDDET